MYGGEAINLPGLLAKSRGDVALSRDVAGETWFSGGNGDGAPEWYWRVGDGPDVEENDCCRCLRFVSLAASSMGLTEGKVWCDWGDEGWERTTGEL